MPWNGAQANWSKNWKHLIPRASPQDHQIAQAWAPEYGEKRRKVVAQLAYVCT